MALGILLEVGALIAASFSTKIWHLFLTQGIIFGWGIGLLFTTSMATISQWFSTKRSVANGIATAGSGIGGLIFSLGVQEITARIGVEWSFRIVAVCVGVVNTVCTLLIKDRNKAINPNQRGFDYRLFRRREFLLVIAWSFFSMLGYIVILFSLPDYAASVGMSERQGSILAAMLNLGTAFGRPLVGLVSDHFGRINVSGGMTLLSGLSCLIIWMWARSFAAALVFSLMIGAVCGVFWMVRFLDVDAMQYVNRSQTDYISRYRRGRGDHGTP
jgi:MFS family permease